MAFDRGRAITHVQHVLSRLEREGVSLQVSARINIHYFNSIRPLITSSRRRRDSSFRFQSVAAQKFVCVLVFSQTTRRKIERMMIHYLSSSRAAASVSTPYNIRMALE